MKSSTKKWFIAAGILILLGIIVSIISFAASGFDLSAFVSTDDRTKKEYEIQRQDAVSLDITTISSDIILKESNSDAIKITCYESDKISFNTSVNNGVLKIEETDNRKWFEYLLPFIGFKDVSLIVELPKDNWENIALNSTSGDINAQSFNCVEFSSDTTSGDINLGSISAENQIRLDTTSGEITLKNSSSGTIHSESTSGDINFGSISAENEIRLDTTSGEVSLSSISDASSLSASSTSGDIEIYNAIVDSIEVTTVSGNIDFSKIEADKYKMSATSGDIEGGIVGNENSVTFFTDTTSGDISVPYPSMGDKTFTAETVSGDIEVEFQNQ